MFLIAMILKSFINKKTQNMTKKIILLFCILFSLNLSAQDDLLDLLEEETKPVVNYTTATFKTTKIVSSNSVETNGEGQLNFVIQHRFGRVTSGINQFFGLDNANLRLAIEYGILDNLDIGFGRSSYEKKLDFFVKYRFLRQSTGAKKMPVTMAGFASMQIITGTLTSNPRQTDLFTSRMSYSYQLMIARKFGKWVSIQLTPTLVHKNFVYSAQDRNDIFSLGIGTSIRVSGSVRVNLEYYWTFEGQVVSPYNQERVLNPISFGVDIETGGHVFQLHLSNSRGMLEKELVAETTGDITKAHINFGFNITRSFALYDAKRMRQKRALKKKEKI